MSVDVSVVVPTCNRPGPLTETLESVLGQAACNLQVIVVDDSPEMTAREAVASFNDPRLRYQPNPTPSGGFPARVRNYGVQFATGRFVHFLDDDDHAPAGLYRDAVTAFDTNPNVGVIFGRVVPFGTDEEKLAHERAFFADAARRAGVLNQFGKRWPMAIHILFVRTLLVCGAGMVRRECIAGVGGFDPAIRYGEDAGFYARAMRKYGARFIDRPFLEYRIWPHSIAHAPDLAHDTIVTDFKKMQARYLREAGMADYVVAKLAAKTVLRVI